MAANGAVEPLPTVGELWAEGERGRVPRTGPSPYPFRSQRPVDPGGACVMRGTDSRAPGPQAGAMTLKQRIGCLVRDHEWRRHVDGESVVFTCDRCGSVEVFPASAVHPVDDDDSDLHSHDPGAGMPGARSGLFGAGWSGSGDGGGWSGGDGW